MQLVVLAVLKVAFHFDYLWATALAVETAVIPNFLWHQRFTWFDRISLDRARTGDALARLLKFNLSTGAFSIIGNLSLMELLVGVAHLHYLVANMITISACSIVNFLVSDRWVFQEERNRRTGLISGRKAGAFTACVVRLAASLGWLGHFGWSLGGSQPQSYEELRSGVGAGTYTIGHADAAITVAREGEAREFLAHALNPLQPLEVPDIVLRHCTLPFKNPGEKRFGSDTNDLSEFLAYDAEDFFVRGLQYLFIACAAQKATNQGAVVPGSVRELVVHKRGSEHALGLAARHEKAESRRQGRTHIVVVPQCHSDGRAVVDTAEFSAESRTARPQKGCSCPRRHGNNDAIKSVGLSASGDEPVGLPSPDFQHGCVDA